MKRKDGIMLALLLAALAFLRRRIEWGPGWMWPVPPLKTKDGQLYDPVISDGVGSPRGDGRIHNGVDIMYRRKARGDRPEYKPGTTDGTPMFFAPMVTIHAAKDGTIWSAGKTPRGFSVVIDHGKPFATYYTHMTALATSLHRNGKDIVTGKPTRVKAGDVIGLMGFDPMDGAKLRHLHFAVWHGGTDENAVDPEAAMRFWTKPPTFTI